MSEWQPIETAPKDGTRVIVFTPAYMDTSTRVGGWAFNWPARVDIAAYEVSQVLGGVWRGHLGRCEPAFWMPLPEPPVTR